MSPKVSIVIPVYNVQDYIARCLESCINQTLRDIEIIIVDDCGSDDSIKIAKEYAAKDTRISIIHNPKNLGTFHARKYGILKARAEFCMFADPDDYFEPYACELAYQTIIIQQTDMVHLSMAYKPKSYRIKPIVHSDRLEDKAMRYFLTGGNNMQGLCDKIYKTSILVQALHTLEFVSPPLKLHEDGLLVFVASLESRSYFGLKQCIYYYCYNPKSITKDKSPSIIQTKQEQTSKFLEILEHLHRIYPHHTQLIKKYQTKIASALMMESRDFGIFDVYKSMQILRKYGFYKTCDYPAYLKAMLLSLRYSFRWQNLIRIVLFCMSLGRVKI